MLFCLIHSSRGLGSMGNNNIFNPLTREPELFQSLDLVSSSSYNDPTKGTTIIFHIKIKIGTGS